MAKKSALGLYRKLEVELAEVRAKHAKAETEHPDETRLVEQMTDIWYNSLTITERATLSKEA